MLLKTVFQQEMINKEELLGLTVVIIDVLRATSTIVTALANGAKAVIPVAAIDEARKLSQGKRLLLTGEQDAARIPGFDLGNSPLEFTADKVAGQTIVMVTSNGTRAFLASAKAAKILAGSFLNAGAVAARLVEGKKDALLLCSGTKGSFAVEDFAAAGCIVNKVTELLPGVAMDDAAVTAAALFRQYSGDIEGLLCRGAHGKNLAVKGYSKDLRFCARQDLFNLAPEFSGGKIA